MKNNYVIGDPVGHSGSPVLHNEAYKQLGIENEFIFSPRKVAKENLASFMHQIMHEEDFNGLAVTMPHKSAIIEYLDDVDEHAGKIGAINTVVKRSGKLIGFNTDWLGAQSALIELTNLNGKKVSLLGTGSTARGVAYAMRSAGVQLTIFGRNNDKVINISREFGAMPASIESKTEIASADIIINATSIGISEESDTELLDTHYIDSNHIIFDVIYGRETNLVRAAKQSKASVLTGLDMLLHQAIPQCELHTGMRPDIEKLRKFMNERSNESR